MQIVDNGTPTQIKEIFAYSPITRTSSLPLPHLSQGMLNGYSLAQLITPLRGLLALA
jgi:hypothetical protein